LGEFFRDGCSPGQQDRVISLEEMLEQTIQPAEFPSACRGETTSPFEDLSAIHALYEDRIFRFLLFSLHDRDLALTLTQDTFLQAWRSRASFRGECAVSTWLMKIAINLLRSHTRTEMFRFWKKAAESSVDAEEMQWKLTHPASSAEERLVAEEQLKQVWATVEKLSKPQRTVFLLRFVEELELTEIAHATGMTLPTTKTHLYRALESVRGALAGADRRPR
jgi:RNA polymerase sigma-70 factor (ECF subfamily)